MKLSGRHKYIVSSALSPSEIEILRLVANGCLDKEIAAMRGRSMQTVKRQIASIRDKLGAVDRTNAVSIGYQKGILHGE